MAFAEWLRKQTSDEERQLAILVKKNRPPPLRNYDQIYMEPDYMVLQTKIMATEIANKKILFMGDGDGMSLMFGLFVAQGKIGAPDHMLVLDFDKRILKSINSFSKKYKFEYLISTYCYNVKDPIPKKYFSWADFFYVNPPYSSKTKPKGLSAIIFIDRCLDFCIPKSSGCVLLPYSNERPWTQEVMKNVQTYFINEVGCYLRELVIQMHAYYLDDDPNLKSATAIIDRLKLKKTRYRGQKIPSSDLNNFYGSQNELMPKYINERGKPVFNK